MIEILLRYSILALNSVAVISMTHWIHTKRINCIHNIVCKLVVKLVVINYNKHKKTTFIKSTLLCILIRLILKTSDAHNNKF